MLNPMKKSKWQGINTRRKYWKSCNFSCPEGVCGGVCWVSGGCFGPSLLCPGYLNAKSIEKSPIGIVLQCIIFSPSGLFLTKKGFSAKIFNGGW